MNVRNNKKLNFSEIKKNYSIYILRMNLKELELAY